MPCSSDISRTAFFDGVPSSESFLTAGGSSVPGIKTGYEQLCEFSLTSLKALIRAEEKGPCGSSSLSKICLMDIGVMSYSGRSYYFVSEIERTIGLGIFGQTYIQDIASRLSKLCVELIQ